jgi:RimJ/RimL family protein N-acetyltransferase
MLRSTRIYLSPILPEDLATLFAWINNREDVLFNSSYKPVSAKHHQEWFESQQSKKDTFIFGIRLIESNELIGSCQLHSIHPVHNSAELQIRIGEPSYRSLGYGTESLELLLYFAFYDLNLNRLFLQVFENNTVALNVYSKLGFVKEGVLRQSAYIDGKYVNVIMMGILRDDYIVQ